MILYLLGGEKGIKGKGNSIPPSGKGTCLGGKEGGRAADEAEENSTPLREGLVKREWVCQVMGEKGNRVGGSRSREDDMRKWGKEGTEGLFGYTQRRREGGVAVSESRGRGLGGSGGGVLAGADLKIAGVTYIRGGGAGC